MTPTRVVVVTRPSELELLLERHVTLGQVEFFLRGRGRPLADLEERQAANVAARRAVLAAIPVEWRRAAVDRANLDRFLFEPDDIVVAVGQDGLVANLAKYLHGQPVIGVGPEPDHNTGMLVRHGPDEIGALLAAVHTGAATTVRRTMVRATLDDGRHILALNELFVGHRSHQSARYMLTASGTTERQCSSGVIVATGTGATGWARSIHRERRSTLALPSPTDRAAAYFVREGLAVAPHRHAAHRRGARTHRHAGGRLGMEDGIVFGDGIETDTLPLEWGAPGRDRNRRHGGGPRGESVTGRTAEYSSSSRRVGPDTPHHRPTLEEGPVRSEALEDLRERALELVQTRPAETTPEATWLVAELERSREVLLGLIDHLLTEELEPKEPGPQ